MTNKNKSFYERFMIKKAEFQKQKEEDALLNQVMKEVLSSIDEDDYINYDISEDVSVKGLTNLEYQSERIQGILKYTRDSDLTRYMVGCLEDYFNRRYKLIAINDYDGIDLDNNYISAQRDNRFFDFLEDSRVAEKLGSIQEGLDDIIQELYERDTKSGSIKQCVINLEDKT